MDRKRAISHGAFRSKRGRKLSYKLSKAISSIIPIDESIIDIGAGNGLLTKHLKNRGYDIFGVDGIANVHKYSDGLLKWVDLAEDCSKFYDSADWGLFFEVGEHVPKEFESRLIDNVIRMARNAIILSWSIDEKHINHINCRTQVYVACEFAKRGWFVDEKDTVMARSIVRTNRYLNHRLIVFRKG